jgi:hypothetical protein
LRIRALPPTVTKKLGLTSHKQAAPYLKKVQTLYCDRLSNNRLCPTQCWRCYNRLDDMAARLDLTDVAHWHVVVRDTVIELLEELHEPKPVKGSGEIRSVASLADQLRGCLCPHAGNK